MRLPFHWIMREVCDNGQGTKGYVYRLWARPFRRLWEHR